MSFDELVAAIGQAHATLAAQATKAVTSASRCATGSSGFTSQSTSCAAQTGQRMANGYSFWNASPAIAQQPASQLMGIPWWHHVTILTKCKQPDEALRGQLPSMRQLERELGLENNDGDAEEKRHE